MNDSPRSAANLALLAYTAVASELRMACDSRVYKCVCKYNIVCAVCKCWATQRANTRNLD